MGARQIKSHKGKYTFFLLLISLVLFGSNSANAQVCDLIFQKGSNIQVNGICAPVNVYAFDAQYTLFSINGASSFQVEFDWGDGTVDLVNATIDNSGPYPVVKATDSHNYPSQVNGSCTYNASSTLIIDGQRCNDSKVPQIVTVWDKDNANGGHINIDPYEVQICVGEDSTVVFHDVSTWNCTAPEVDKHNYQDRATQFVYGIGDPSNRIPGIELHNTDGSKVYHMGITGAVGTDTVPGDVLLLQLYC